MNKANQSSYKIFKAGSVTFFTASLFFPSQIKGDVFDLYAFVRVFDNFVDHTPQQPDAYFAMKADYYEALNGKPTDNSVISHFIEVQKKYGFEQKWVDAFFTAMEMDLAGREYQTIGDTEQYMYGSAEVIGLMMARIMKVEESAYPYAQLLGKAFQYMNFLRDIKEDLELGRIYIPRDVRAQFGLENFSENHAKQEPEKFIELMRSEIQRYRKWMAEARSGFHYLPKRYRIPIASASDMFDHVIDQIEQNPMMVFEQKLKPSRLKIMGRVVYHSIS